MKRFSMLALSLALATGTALAADPPKPATRPAATMPPMDHSKMDMSGKTPADHQQMANNTFAAIDTNKDGCLSKAEFAKHHAMMQMKHGKMMSMDDGKMSMDHQKMADKEFASLDKNHDGSLTKSEIPAKHPLATHFSMLDANKDGRVSQAEFAKHHGM